MNSSHRIGFEVREEPRYRERSVNAKLDCNDSAIEARYTQLGSKDERIEDVHYFRAVHSIRSTVVAVRPPLFAESFGRMRELQASATATTLTQAHLQLAADFCGVAHITVEEPWIAAGEDGSLGVDWRHDGRCLAITFTSAGDVEFYATDARTEEAGIVAGEPDQIRLISWLALGRAFSGSQIDE